jgi:hypothetical protein
MNAADGAVAANDHANTCRRVPLPGAPQWPED